MDHGLLELFKLGASLGTTSLVLILWYWSSRDTARILEVYRKDLSDVLKKYDGAIEYGDLTIAESKSDRLLPAGIFARWKTN